MLTPIDIQNHTLKSAVRGYSKKETDDFLDQILSSYEELYKENRELKDKVTSLSEGIQYYKQMETTLQKALVLAEKTSTETQEAAKCQADAMMKETKAQAESIRNAAQAEADALRKEAKAYAEVMNTRANSELETTKNQVRKLMQSYENYRLQFKKLAESQIEMLDSESFAIFSPDLEETLENMEEAQAEAPVQPKKEAYFTLQPEEVPEETKETVENSEEDEETSSAPVQSEEEEEKDSLTSDAEAASVVEEESVAEKPHQKTSEELLRELLSENVSAFDDDADEEEAESANNVADTKTDKSNLQSSEDSIRNEWNRDTPKVDGFDHLEVSKSVEPEKKEDSDSPFTFIDL